VAQVVSAFKSRYGPLQCDDYCLGKESGLRGGLLSAPEAQLGQHVATVCTGPYSAMHCFGPGSNISKLARSAATGTAHVLLVAPGRHTAVTAANNPTCTTLCVV
jgi:hypothetical protein